MRVTGGGELGHRAGPANLNCMSRHVLRSRCRHETHIDKLEHRRLRRVAHHSRLRRDCLTPNRFKHSPRERPCRCAGRLGWLMFTAFAFSVHLFRAWRGLNLRPKKAVCCMGAIRDALRLRLYWPHDLAARAHARDNCPRSKGTNSPARFVHTECDDSSVQA